MNHKIKIMNLGPIKSCEINIDDFTVITGPQSSGKSTLAKAVYFFRTIKDDIESDFLRYKYLLKNNYYTSQINVNDLDYLEIIKKNLSNKFIRLFGASVTQNSKISIEYIYSNDTYIKVKAVAENTLCKIDVEFSNNLASYIKEKIGTGFDKNEMKNKLKELFNDEYDAIFIPAGRSIITTLSSQLSYLFATMDDTQKSSIDYCTQKYIEYIIKIQPDFSKGIEGLANNSGTEHDPAFYNIIEYIKKEEQLIKLINKVLKGNYAYVNGEERLYFESEGKTTDEYVRINYASSGQQETVWLFNILFYIMAKNIKAYIILEEPESHLYPDAQKIVAEILALISNCNCKLMITTHSPYILGALNNLIYAEHLSHIPEISEKTDDIVCRYCKIKNSRAYQIRKGNVASCNEEGTSEMLIKNEVIDGASEDINRTYDALFDIDPRYGE